MKFPSLKFIAEEAKYTAQRFPAVLLFACAGVIAMVAYTCLTHGHYSSREAYDFLWKLAMTFVLGIPLFFSVIVFTEEKLWFARGRIILHAVAAALLVWYYFHIQQDMKLKYVYEYFLIYFNLHLLVAIAPFIFEVKYERAFWQYNKALFLRILLSILYSGTIYVGLAIGFAALDHLFDVFKFDDRLYANMWFIVTGIFNTWFFLARAPQNIRGLELKTDYPKGLKFFTQFVLVPLVTLYFAILYLYMGKIVFTMTLPVGWLSSFIICASILGILTLLLVHPLRENSEHAWIKYYGRYFYIALIPLVVLMAVAISRRIFDYGITEERYFVLLFTVWLLYIAGRFTFRPQFNIKVIPTSLFILMLVATFGPLSASNVAFKSQTKRLKALLAANRMWEGNVIRKAEHKIPRWDRAQMSSIVDYVHRNHGLKTLDQWINTRVDWETANAQSLLKDVFGFEYIYSYGRFDSRYFAGQSPDEWFNFHVNEMVPLSVTGFDYIAPIHWSFRDATRTLPVLEIGSGMNVAWQPETEKVLLSMKGLETLAIDMNGFLVSLGGELTANMPVTPAEATLDAENKDLRVRVHFSNVSGSIKEDQKKFTHAYGRILIDIKEKP